MTALAEALDPCECGHPATDHIELIGGGCMAKTPGAVTEHCLCGKYRAAKEPPK